MAKITLTLEEYEALRDLAMKTSTGFDQMQVKAPVSKPKRKVSKYGKEFGKQLTALKKKHPRTNVNQLMEKAHAKTRSALGMPRKSRKS